MIKSFVGSRTAALFKGIKLKGVPNDVAERAHVKLLMIDAVTRLQDLRVPPGNRLEALKGDRSGQHCIRVSDQWRICFRWDGADAHGVEFTDYP